MTCNVPLDVSSPPFFFMFEMTIMTLRVRVVARAIAEAD